MHLGDWWILHFLDLRTILRGTDPDSKVRCYRGRLLPCHINHYHDNNNHSTRSCSHIFLFPSLANVLGVPKHGLHWTSARNISVSQDKLLDKWSHRREVVGRAYSDV